MRGRAATCQTSGVRSGGRIRRRVARRIGKGEISGERRGAMLHLTGLGGRIWKGEISCERRCLRSGDDDESGDGGAMHHIRKIRKSSQRGSHPL